MDASQVLDIIDRLEREGAVSPTVLAAARELAHLKDADAGDEDERKAMAVLFRAIADQYRGMGQPKVAEEFRRIANETDPDVH